MKKIIKLIGSVVFAAVIIISLASIKASAETITVTANDGKTTDFIEGWAAMSTMGANINEDGETVLGAETALGFGHRLQNLNRVDLYSQQINYTMDVPDGALGFYALVQSEFINQGTSLAFIVNRTEAGKTTLIIGQSHEATGDTIIKTIELQDKSEHSFDIKFSKADDGVILDLSIDGTTNQINISDKVLKACLGTTEGAVNSSLNQIFGGWDGIISVVVHSYSDANRVAYLEGIKTEYDGYVDSLASILSNVNQLKADSSVEELVTERNAAVETEIAIANSSFRNYEKTTLNNKITEIYTALDKLAGDNEELKSLIKIASYIELFNQKSMPASLTTKEETQAVESIKTSIDYDKFIELEDSETYADYVGLMEDKYSEARDYLNNAKDALVLKDIEAFEEAVKELSSDGKIQAAGDAKNTIKISNALLENQDSYTERVSAATVILSKAMKSYAGDLAKYWDIYNVTFIKANDANEIEFAASDYYNDDPSSDVGISFRDKLKLDGLSIEFTYTSGNIGSDVWLGLDFLSELDVMHVSDTDSYSASTGITTLIIPKDGSTEFQMGYPKLYGNCPEGGWPSVPVSTLGTKFKIEFKKNSNIYEVYVTAGDAEAALLCSLDAGILEANLPNGEGYLNIGYCDKGLGTGKITIHTVNGQPAASLIAENVYVSGEDKATTAEVTNTPVPTEAAVQEPVDDGQNYAPVIIVVSILLVLAIGIVFYIRSSKNNNMKK